MEQFQDVAPQFQKFRAISLTRTFQIDRNHLFNTAGSRAQNDDAIAHVNRFINIMRHKQNGGAAIFPEAIATSASYVSTAVTTVPPWMSVRAIRPG